MNEKTIINIAGAIGVVAAFVAMAANGVTWGGFFALTVSLFGVLSFFSLLVRATRSYFPESSMLFRTSAYAFVACGLGMGLFAIMLVVWGAFFR